MKYRVSLLIELTHDATFLYKKLLLYQYTKKQTNTLETKERKTNTGFIECEA